MYLLYRFFFVLVILECVSNSSAVPVKDRKGAVAEIIENATEVKDEVRNKKFGFYQFLRNLKLSFAEIRAITIFKGYTYSSMILLNLSNGC